MILNLRNIQVSPEQIREKEIIKEREVKDGEKLLLDDKGNPVIDKDGNKVKVDNMVKVRCQLYQFTQFKTAKVTGQVKYIDKITKQVLQTYPISSQFDFQHIYAKYKGDKRALEDNFLDLIQLQLVPFPTNEQMIYDCGQDLKQRLKNIIISKPLTIIGKQYPVIDGELKGEIITITSDNVTVDGLFIINVGTSYTSDYAAVRVKKSKNFVIQNLVLEKLFFDKVQKW